MSLSEDMNVSRIKFSRVLTYEGCSESSHHAVIAQLPAMQHA